MQVWNQCRSHLKNDLSETEYHTWILPLQAAEENGQIRLYAPNHFVMNWVSQHYAQQIAALCTHLSGGEIDKVLFEIGTLQETDDGTAPQARVPRIKTKAYGSATNLIADFTFDKFIEGNSNHLARAAGFHIGENPGDSYNPLFIYGGVGLGKTHLMHAIGNMALERKSPIQVVYLHSERFVTEMIKSLQHNRISEFKKYYRNVNVLLIDDVQFFAGKERSQEEFFYTFNTLLESKQQVVLSSDRFPKEVEGLEERLKSRFGSGLTVQIESPELETRIAILQSKAICIGIDLPEEVASLIGKNIRSNIRDLEGALQRLAANSKFTGMPISLRLTRKVLQDMFAAQDKQVTIENIQKMVAKYYKIRTIDLLSSKRNRSIARPRQVAMTLAKELTKYSLPEIGEAFGGKNHTTVLYANKRIKELRESDATIEEDYRNLLRSLVA